MRSIEELNKYDFTLVIEYMKKYVDITINDSKKEFINDALETIYIEEIIFFLNRYNISKFKYDDRRFLKFLSIYLNEEVKSYIESQGYKAKENYFMKEKLEYIVLN